jgi:hypothetical protein
MKRCVWLAFAMALTVTGCGAAGGAAGPSPSATQAGQFVMVGDQDNGSTVTLSPGEHLRLVLGSTYWTIQGSSEPQVLRAEAQPVLSAQPSGCVPGGGCGTASATFLAVTTGQAVVTATRTSCGEGMGCTGDTGRFSLNVVVR